MPGLKVAGIATPVPAELPCVGIAVGAGDGEGEVLVVGVGDAVGSGEGDAVASPDGVEDAMPDCAVETKDEGPPDPGNPGMAAAAIIRIRTGNATVIATRVQAGRLL